MKQQIAKQPPIEQHIKGHSFVGQQLKSLCAKFDIERLAGWSCPSEQKHIEAHRLERARYPQHPLVGIQIIADRNYYPFHIGKLTKKWLRKLRFASVFPTFAVRKQSCAAMLYIGTKHYNTAKCRKQ